MDYVVSRRAAAALSLLVATAMVAPAPAAVRQEFRALWVDTFNTPLNNHADVMRVVSSAQAARLNVILAQVRRRGDAWYLDALEPPPDFTPIQAGFDPLADLIASAHVLGLHVHAFVIAGAIWNKDPALPPPANGPPLDPRHAFNRTADTTARRAPSCKDLTTGSPARSSPTALGSPIRDIASAATSGSTSAIRMPPRTPSRC